MNVRAARLADLPALLAIERASFTTDRIAPKNLRRLLLRGHCALVVAETRRAVVGYALVLFRRGSRRARLYSLAVDPRHRRAGAATRLLSAIEKRVRGRGLLALTLEAGVANEAAATLYRRKGYRLLARLGPYYADGSHADRWIKSLAPRAR